jgi:archaellum biogenesis ATPase FlaH
MSSEWTRIYYARGLIVLPLVPGDKRCVINDWPTLDRETLFKMVDDGCNIGLRLDDLVCLDIERPELWHVFIELSPEEFSSKTWVQRTGKGLHVLFRGRAEPFRVDGFAEIRSGPHQYIVVAPSIHPETHRPYEWISNIEETPIGEIGDVGVARLRAKLEVLKRFKKFIDVMVDCWQKYHRHHLSLWVSGVLYKMDLPFDEGETVLKAIVYLAHDEEGEDRLRCLRDTYEKPSERVKAWSGLREELTQITGSPEGADKIIKLLPFRKGLIFEAVPLAKLIEDAKEITYLSRPLLPRGCLIVLAGRGGVGKSMLGLHIAHCVASGKPIFNVFEARQARVCLLDNENSPPIIRDRVERLGLEIPDGFDCINFTSWRLDGRNALSRLKQLIQTNNYGLVVMDNWTTFVSSVDENDAVAVSNLLTRLRKIAYETGCTILVIHHQRKSLAYAVDLEDSLRGSSVIYNEPDVILHLEIDKITDDRILRSLKNRLGEPFAYRLALEWNEEEERMMYVFRGEEKTDTNILKAAKAIDDYISRVGQARRKDLLSQLPFNKSTLDRALQHLVKYGRIERVSKGLYRKPAALIENTLT